MTDFTFHSLGVVLGRLQELDVFELFVQDVLIDGGVLLVALPPTAMYQVVTVMNLFGLDFDDAYQYVAAEREQATLVSFDRDFDKTTNGRHAPVQVLATL